MALQSQELEGARVRRWSVGPYRQDEHLDMLWGVSSLSVLVVEEFKLWIAWRLVLYS